jgi:hypothetical protein
MFPAAKTRALTTVLRRWSMISALATLGLLSMWGAEWLHFDRISRYDEADSATQATFQGDFALSVSLLSFGLACLYSGWMAFTARTIADDAWVGASQTGREILVGSGTLAAALVLTKSARQEISGLFESVAQGIPVFLAVGAWMLIIGPGRTAYGRSRGLTPTYSSGVESLTTRTPKRTVSILRPWIYALFCLALVAANGVAAVFFSADREMQSEFFLLTISQSDLMIAALVFLSLLDLMFLVTLFRLRRVPAADFFEFLASLRPLIFLNVLLLYAEWYNLYVVPIYSTAVSALAVAIVTVLGPALLLSFCGPVLTESARIHGRARQVKDSAVSSGAGNRLRVREASDGEAE